MKAIIEEADSETAAKMQELALAEVSLQMIICLLNLKYMILCSIRQQVLSYSAQQRVELSMLKEMLIFISSLSDLYTYI